MCKDPLLDRQGPVIFIDPQPPGLVGLLARTRNQTTWKGADISPYIQTSTLLKSSLQTAYDKI